METRKLTTATSVATTNQNATTVPTIKNAVPTTATAPTAQNNASLFKSDVPKVDLAKELEQAKKQIEELKKTQQLPQTLEERMAYFAKMQEISEKIIILENSISMIAKFIKKIEDDASASDLDSKSMVHIKIVSKDYDLGDIEISNQSAVKDFLDSIVQRLLDNKILLKNQLTE